MFRSRYQLGSKSLPPPLHIHCDGVVRMIGCVIKVFIYIIFVLNTKYYISSIESTQEIDLCCAR